MAELWEALAWRLSQLGFDPSYGKLLSGHIDEFWYNETDMFVDDCVCVLSCFFLMGKTKKKKKIKNTILYKLKFGYCVKLILNG